MRSINEDYRIINDHVVDVIWKLDLNGKATFVTPSVQRLTGYTIKEFLSQPLEKFLEKEGKKMADWEILKLLKRNATTPITFEQECICKDGTKKWTEVTLKLSMDVRGKAEGIVGITRDISERKKADERLKASELKYRNLFEGVNNPITLLDREGVILLINTYGARNLGLSSEACIGKSIFKILPNLDNSFIKLYRRVVDEQVEVVKEFQIQLGSEVKWFWSIHQPILDPLGQKNVVQLISVDITEQKRIQEELQRSQKLESLGLMAGGIAHDFNNLLGGLFGFIDLSRQTLESNHPALVLMDKAMESMIRAKDLSTQLLTFSKGGSPIKEVISITQVLKNSAHLALSGSNIHCDFKVSPSLHLVKADRGQLNQVFNNVLLNSRQAMAEGGTITIKGTNEAIEKRNQFNLPRGNYVKIGIVDQGVGIPEENLGRVFDPFFTTKPKGSGLGLATSYSIIKKHDGYISVESRFKIGTTITIFLPVTKGKQDRQIVQYSDRIKGTGRIILVDDDEVILEFTRKMLETVGYDVVSFKNGEEAINQYKLELKTKNSIDLVILDLTIHGGMGGDKIVQKILQLNPKAKVIVSSGYSNSPIIANFREYGFSGKITKPYTTNELGQVIKKVLSKKTP